MTTRAPSRPLFSLALLATLAVGSTSVPAAGDVRAAAPVDGASGIGDPYWPLDGNGGIDVSSYEVSNRYALATKRLSGRTRVELTATQDLASFSLDFLLKVSAVTVDGERADFAKTDGGHELRITPDEPLAAGSEHTVVVSYADRPSRRSYAGERNWLASRREVITMNEPHMAPWWFPANDHPLDKAVVDVKVRVPNGREVISNGKLRGRDVGRRWTRWHWRADEPMVPYLAFFAAGDFTIEKGRHRGLPWLVAVSESLSARDQAASMRLMRKTPAVVAGLEKDLGPYPFSVVGGITTGLNPGFALENQTRPTYPAVGAGYTSLVVHELAHQWFGDDIAVQHWADIWLNEGFATFMEWRWTETHGGRSGAAILRSYYDGVGPSADFWKVLIGDPGAERIFDGAVYSRGAMTLQALRNRVGDDVFWRILRTWIREQKGGNGSSTEFEELAARVSGQDLRSFFTAWLRTPARPAPTADNGLG
ncbi:peptidase [Nocardioides flavus (ex Wang et al. 2016)]|uniref:Aminopeptidase N n=1 Tax=Nocardioides flavus (ex Wang et al. 2016) TaxID=2058780 RepID=A0ABQ3HKD7_9ACTN|nr:M1 family metallopeptidase [Nocardioides flavus (ex Wang et al. 2016)]GHE17373.1 peptidase [Nocardioides flavus (ex Wang et al. 2016)]